MCGDVLQALQRELDGMSPGLDLAGMNSQSIGTAAGAGNGSAGHLPGGCGLLGYGLGLGRENGYGTQKSTFFHIPCTK